MEPNIRWQYEVLLWSSWLDVCKLLCFTQHVSVVLPVEHHEKLLNCASNNITMENVLSFYVMEHLRFLCNCLWGKGTV